MNSSMLDRLRRLPRWPLWAAAPIALSAAMAAIVDLHAPSTPDIEVQASAQDKTAPLAAGIEKPKR